MPTTSLPLRRVVMPETWFCTKCGAPVTEGAAAFIRHEHDGIFCSTACEREYAQEWADSLLRLTAVHANGIAHGSTAAPV